MQVCSASMITATPLTCELFDQQVGDLLGHALLDLGPPRNFLDHPGQFAQADDPRPGKVGDVGLAQEGQHVVLAHALEADVPHQDHFIVALGEELLQMPAGIEVQAGE